MGLALFSARPWKLAIVFAASFVQGIHPARDPVDLLDVSCPRRLCSALLSFASVALSLPIRLTSTAKKTMLSQHHSEVDSNDKGDHDV